MSYHETNTSYDTFRAIIDRGETPTSKAGRIGFATLERLDRLPRFRELVQWLDRFPIVRRQSWLGEDVAEVVTLCGECADAWEGGELDAIDSTSESCDECGASGSDEPDADRLYDERIDRELEAGI